MSDVTQTAGRLEQEWNVIAAAPFHFLAAVLVVAVVIWAVMWLINKGQINALKSQNDVKEDRLSLAQDKLASAEEELAKSPPTDESSDQNAIIASTIAETVRTELGALRGVLAGTKIVARGSRIYGEGQTFGPVPLEDIDRPKKDTDNNS